MPVSVDKKLAALPAERRKRIEAMTAEMLEQEATLKEFRQAHDFTQIAVARKMGVDQGEISKIEGRTDMFLSTLRRYIIAAGGDLYLVATHKDGKPVIIRGIAELETDLTLPAYQIEKDKKERAHSKR